MKRFTASILAVGLAACVGNASAQTYFDGDPRYQDDRYGNGYQAGTYQGAQYAYARVLSVRPVTGSGYGSYPASSQQRCYQRRDDYASGRYGDDPYRNDGYYDRGRYARGGDYRDDGYYGRDYRGTSTGRTVATVVGGIVGAAIGSQVGGGSARYATSALGTMVGGIAGQKVYENSVRSRAPRSGVVTVCDPVPDDRYYGTSGSGANAYDVTYEYGGRQYTSRTNYHPGDRIRVLVDVRPE